MKLSEEIKDKIKYNDSVTDLGSLTELLRVESTTFDDLLPKIEQLEKDNEELIEALIEKVKIDEELYKQLMTIEVSEKYYKHHKIGENIKLIEKATGKTWEEINGK